MSKRPRRGVLLARSGTLAASCLLTVVAHAQGSAAEPAGARTRWFADAWMVGALAEPLLVRQPHFDPGYGIGFGLGLGRRPLPLAFGIDVVALRGSGTTALVPIRLGDTDAQLVETRTRQTIHVDAWLRAQPTRGFWLPYAEITGGVAMRDYVYTLRFPSAVDATTSYKRQASSGTFGLGLGLDVPLAHAPQEHTAIACVSIGVRHVWGGRASTAPGASSADDFHADTTLFTLGLFGRAPLGFSSGKEEK